MSHWHNSPLTLAAEADYRAKCAEIELENKKAAKSKRRDFTIPKVYSSRKKPREPKIFPRDAVMLEILRKKGPMTIAVHADMDKSWNRDLAQGSMERLMKLGMLVRTGEKGNSIKPGTGYVYGVKKGAS